MIRQLFSVILAGAIAVSLATSVQAAANDPLGIFQALNLPQGTANYTGNSAPTTPGAATVAPAAQPPVPTAPVPTVPAQAAPEPEIHPQPPQFFDYTANINSDVFGANLFTGAFAREGATQFNPNYAVAVGDNIQVRLWGAFDFDALLTVDPKGNIFLPHAGPVQVLGVRNIDLQPLVESALRRVFRSNVFSYASLAAAQPVRVFVGGFVNRPGLYPGTSMDSLLHYMDQAGGIDPERGSFLSVQVKRGQQVRATVNLYDFLLNGTMPLIQLADGDVIFVVPRQYTVKVSGLAANAKRFEFADSNRTVADLTKLAKPMAVATNMRVVRNTGTIRNVEYHPLADAARVALQNGDEIEFTADKKPGTITVRVEGETLSVQEYVLNYGSRLGQLMSKIKFRESSDTADIQLFRVSVHDRQKEMLQTSLKRLESAVLTARSGTDEESQLRVNEANLVLQWVERAKAIEPTGQVMITRSEKMNDLLLEDGDIIRIPALDNLVLVSGEVLFPNSIAYNSKNNVDDYIEDAGGFSQGADTSRIVLAHRDGSFEDVGGGGVFFHPDIRTGDQIFVLPKVEVKNRQIMKEISMMIYQIALGARVVTQF